MLISTLILLALNISAQNAAHSQYIEKGWPFPAYKWTSNSIEIVPLLANIALNAIIVSSVGFGVRRLQQKGRFRIHLLTAIAALFFCSLLLYLNAVPKTFPPNLEWNTAQRDFYGWPFVFYRFDHGITGGLVLITNDIFYNMVDRFNLAKNVAIGAVFLSAFCGVFETTFAAIRRWKTNAS